MSWFEYGTPQKNKRHLRKGVWLRVNFLPKVLLKAAKPKLRLFEEIRWVTVCEMKDKDQVLLEFWCQGPGDFKLNRFNVFHILTKEDPKWICEGDLGRGYKDC